MKSYLKRNNTSSSFEALENFNGVMICFAVIAVLAMISIIYSEKRVLKIENSLLKEQIELQYRNYLSSQQQEDRIHKLYHDIGNHVMTIQVMVRNGENELAKNYTESILQEYKDIRKAFYCNHKIINAVLSQKDDEWSDENLKRYAYDFVY